MNHEQIGQEIRRIADEIERLDPGMRPVFTGFSCPTPTAVPRGAFQGGPVMGYEASLAHVRQLLAETRQRIGQGPLIEQRHAIGNDICTITGCEICPAVWADR